MPTSIASLLAGRDVTRRRNLLDATRPPEHVRVTRAELEGPCKHIHPVQPQNQRNHSQPSRGQVRFLSASLYEMTVRVPADAFARSMAGRLAGPRARGSVRSP